VVAQSGGPGEIMWDHMDGEGGDWGRGEGGVSPQSPGDWRSQFQGHTALRYVISDEELI